MVTEGPAQPAPPPEQDPYPAEKGARRRNHPEYATEAVGLCRWLVGAVVLALLLSLVH